MPYESDHLRCVVERITYQNAENGYRRDPGKESVGYGRNKEGLGLCRPSCDGHGTEYSAERTAAGKTGGSADAGGISIRKRAAEKGSPLNYQEFKCGYL